MKQILISPHYIQNQKIRQLVTSGYLSDYFLEKGFMPVMPVFHSQTKTKSELFHLAKIYVSNSSALVLQGGQDIGQEPRDIFEEAILELALEKKIPILGICRGFQLINVYFGGTLKNIENHLLLKDKKATDLNFNNVDLELKHRLKIVNGGVLEKYLVEDSLEVNSAHRQGVAVLGENLRAEAIDFESGLIEAFSMVEKKVLALQWHPEIDFKNQVNRLIFNHWLEWI